MPVHPRDGKDNNHEEMDEDYPEQDASSSDEDDYVSSSASEDGDTSGGVLHITYCILCNTTILCVYVYVHNDDLAEMDDEDCERRRMECLDEMTNLEKQFTGLKDQ